ncbi:MAG TPA: GvpL/GvpF family gas vesicle protein [Actinomycetota bacterium]|nr:GvpL/GvpF family gas vesicle protein [Actinomycetota bacterium]
MTSGLYVYGVAARGLPAPPSGPAIDPERSPGVVEHGALAAIVSEVDVDEFEGDALERNAAAPEWLESKVRAHHAVLEGTLARTAVVPMRFGAIFSSESALRGMLAANETEFERCLERVTGRSEWGLKVHAPEPRDLEEAAVAPRSGRDYLLQKKGRLDARAGAAEAAAELARSVHAALSGVADEAVLVTSRTPAAVNAAYLVAHRARDTFMQRVDALQRVHGECTFEVTGPWPPYNFTSADVTGPRS